MPNDLVDIARCVPEVNDSESHPKSGPAIHCTWSACLPLSDKMQSVTVECLTSTPIPLVFGVPQGSVLGPVLYSLCSHKPCPMPYPVMALITTSTLMTHINPGQCTTEWFHFCSVQHSDLHKRYKATPSWIQSNKLKLNSERPRWCF